MKYLTGTTADVEQYPIEGTYIPGADTAAAAAVDTRTRT